MIGMIVLWENGPIPDGWQVCDGTNGTPDLRDRLVYGNDADGNLRQSGSSSSHTHSNPNTGSAGGHGHSSHSRTSGGPNVSTTRTHVYTSGTAVPDTNHTHTSTISFGSVGGHSHSVGNTGSASNLPPSVKRVYIKKIN